MRKLLDGLVRNWRRLDCVVRVVTFMPALIVVDADEVPTRDDLEDIHYLQEIADRTRAIVVIVPGGKLETLTADEAREALEAIIERSA